MGMLLGSTVYVFSIILAVFLIGLALGSGAGAALSRSVPARAALGWCQILLALGIAWTAYMIADSLPYWPINPMLTASPWQTFQLDMARCLWAILPPTSSGARASLWRWPPWRQARRRFRKTGRRHLRGQHAGSHRRARWASAWCWFPGSARRIRSA